MDSATQFRDVTVVLIDDNQEHLSLMELSIEKAFESESYTITTNAFNTPSEAFTEISENPNQVVLIDYQLQGPTGVDWIADFVKAGVGPVILITSSGDEKIAVEAFREGASDYLVKSDAINSPIILQRSILESLRRYKLEQTNLELSKRLKCSNKNLNSKNQKLTDLTETAHRFVEDVAHEFRTPLTVIKEFASILADGLGGDVTPKQLQYLNYITASTSDLAGLIDDFLNSSRLRTNTMRVNREELTVEHVIDGVLPMLHSKAASKSINLSFEIEDNLPKVFVDSDKMQRSIINLVVNAIKFSEPEGDVCVSVKRFSEHFVTVSVEDNGPGLPEGTVNDLFARFNRGKSGHNRLENGFGLGLSIVKELVSINLGEVHIKSVLGEGSTFSFTVPCVKFESIIKGVVSQSAKFSEKPKISMLAIHREANDQSLEELTAHLNNLSYPMDVVLHPEGSPNVYAIGITDDTDGYQSRIECTDADLQLSGDTHHSPLVVHRCGSWNITQAERSLIDYLHNTHSKEILRA